MAISVNLPLVVAQTPAGLRGTMSVVAAAMIGKKRRTCNADNLIGRPILPLFSVSWSSSRSDFSRGPGNYGRPGGSFYERGSYGGGGYRNRRGGDDSGYMRRDETRGYWKDGVHHIGTRNPRIERELFGTAEDHDRQHTGINFEKYDDIPVEASGRDCPEAVTTVSLKIQCVGKQQRIYG